MGWFKNMFTYQEEKSAEQIVDEVTTEVEEAREKTFNDFLKDNEHLNKFHKETEVIYK